MANCPYCEAQVQEGAKFCTTCGAALPVEAAPVQSAPGVDQPIDVPAQAVSTQPYQDPSYGAQAAQQPYQQPAYGNEAPQPPYQQPVYGNAADQQPYYQQGNAPYGQAQPGYAVPGQPIVNDSGSIGWGVLGFFFPIVGLILFLVWKTTKPQSAKVAGIGAIIGFALGLIMNFFFLR